LEETGASGFTQIHTKSSDEGDSSQMVFNISTVSLDEANPPWTEAAHEQNCTNKIKQSRMSA